MGARQPEIVADVAWGARGVPIPAHGLRVYSGPAWPGMGQLDAWGVPWEVGYESVTTRAYAGHDAGWVDAGQLIGRLRAECPAYIEQGCSVWFCAADASSTPAWALGQITGYAQGFAARCDAEGFHPATIDPYGNRDAVYAARAGLPPGRCNLWGVGTWGFGEGGGAYLMPASSDAAVLQSGNTPGPAPDTDYNAVYVPFADLHLMGGPEPVPVPKGSPMLILVQDGPNAGLWLIGDLSAHHFASVNEVHGGSPAVMSGASFDPILRMVQTNQQTYKPVAGGGAPTVYNISGQATPAT